MAKHLVRILSTTIGVPLDVAYSFAHKPENFPKWASGLSTSLHKTGRGWIADTPLGKAVVRFTDCNPYGVLDHWVRMKGTPEVYIPLRMIANGDETEVELVLYRQSEMSDSDFDRDTGLVESDLASLKALLEAALTARANVFTLDQPMAIWCRRIDQFLRRGLRAAQMLFPTADREVARSNRQDR